MLDGIGGRDLGSNAPHFVARSTTVFPFPTFPDSQSAWCDRVKHLVMANLSDYVQVPSTYYECIRQKSYEVVTP